MKYQVEINSNFFIAKYIQIAECIKSDIELGKIGIGTQLLSITKFSKTHVVARETVEKAYNSLKKQGYIVGIPGKGNFVAKSYESNLKVLMILNKMSSFKKEVYESFLNTVGGNAQVDMQIHHYNVSLFKEIIENSYGKYHYYVIMPHFAEGTKKEDYVNILNTIQSDKLVILDREMVLEKPVINVFQDFKYDIIDALNAEKHLLHKYEQVILLFNPLTNHPVEIIEGVEDFCNLAGKNFQVVSDANDIILKIGTLYITLTDEELATLYKKVKLNDFKLGLDVGLLSFNETVLKELLGITVVSTNFTAMGQIAAEMILAKKIDSVRNEFSFIKRSSL